MFRRPDSTPITLSGAPVLESWNQRDHPDQVRLREYLDAVGREVELPATGDHLAIDLQVGLPSSKSLVSGGGDLDNYLFPIVRRFGAARFDAAFASKRHAATSTLSVGTTTARNPPGMPDLEVRTTASASTKAWKQQIFDACARVVPSVLVAGPVALDIEFRLSPARNWSATWKPAIDSLGPMLGIANANKAFQPNDDRIVQLGLHRILDESMGWDIGVSVWWAEAFT